MRRCGATVATKVFKGNLDASVAGKDGKYGGRSPYTDQDVARAQEYLVEMEKDPFHEIEGRQAAHMLAEFACFWVNDLKDQLRKREAAIGGPRAVKELEEQFLEIESSRLYKDM
jgi:hypothetical protein